MSEIASYQDVLIIIPARDEADTLPEICRALQEKSARFLVIDDGSVDETSKIAEQFGGLVCRHEISLGKGAALRTGFAWALKNSEVKWIGLFDADGQHTIKDLESLLVTAKNSNADLVIGERKIERPMPFERRISNRIMAYLVSKLTGFKISDSQCGLRLISRKFLETYNFTSDGFEVETEMLYAASRLKLKIVTEKIETIYITGRRSHIRPLIDSYRFFKFIVRALLKKA